MAGARMPGKVPLIGHLPIARQFHVLGILLVTFLVFAALIMSFDVRTAAQAAASTATATEMQMLSQRLSSSSTLALQGRPVAFEAVKDTRERFKADLDALQRGGTIKGVTLDAVQDDVAAHAAAGHQDAMGPRRLERRAAARQPAAPDRRRQGHRPRSRKAASSSSSSRSAPSQQGASPRDVEYANQLALLSQRIAKNAAALVSSPESDPELAALLARDAGAFREAQSGLARGGDRRRAAGDAAAHGRTPRVVAIELAKRAAAFDAGLAAVAAAHRQGSCRRSRRYGRSPTRPKGCSRTRPSSPTSTRAAGSRGCRCGSPSSSSLLALATLLLLGKVFLDDARVRAFESEQENKRNQEAILRLLNEMGNLADGDLTVQASVTEDVTGAIADSINFTIEELRTLVKGINSATDQVAKATQDTQAISNRLYEASQRQNREIQQASASVLQMAQSINEVSQSAGQSARVAQQSLAAAEKGAQSVQNQIAGMHEIRAQIQDTSKRIKRLGESSLEIGDIVELIADITEQTNILALNAAIQAASAGEAGRGFTVVAEEVQRLAERSGEATKQIDAIVKTIQADTQDAVAAMEKSTVGVVEGTKLSDTAGGALDEIRRVSRELAELIGAISTQTQKQSASVSDVTRGMQGILQITEETTEGTKQTNVSIGQLTKLAAELRSSVAGFKV